MEKKSLGLFSLVMMNVIAVDSVRTLSFSAVYGFSLVFFYLLAALVFFIPTALVSAELGSSWPDRGGIYVWVREAFGKRWSLIAIWLNWIYNVIWYPTLLALISGTLAYLFQPSLAENPFYVGVSVIGLFWTATLMNCFGMRLSSLFSTIAALLGAIFPMLLIACLGIFWMVQGKPSQIVCSWDTFFPGSAQGDNLGFLTNVLFGLLGLEMVATHAREMRNPQRDYPRSLLISAVIILFTIVFGSLSIALVVPSDQLHLATGVMQAFTIFADTYGLPWLSPLIALCIILGGLGGVGAWIIGPTKGLLVASQDGSLPSFFAKVNARGVPVRILLLQASLVSVLSLLFVFMPTINSSYWILSVITAQLALLVYIALFASALKLRYLHPKKNRPFRVPGKNLGISLVCGLGLLSSSLVIAFGFIPPMAVPFHNVFLYELILVGGGGLCCLIPFFLYRSGQRNRNSF